MNTVFKTLDGNEATAHVAYRASEVIGIYPISPSSDMGEHSDLWASKGHLNTWGDVPRVVEMQSEGGAVASCHGSIQAGTLSCTFTASQGLMLMIPTMYKVAGEMTPFVIHVAARTVATQALSIFGDHSDVMATRATGFAQLSSFNVQEATDMATIAHAATLETQIPFIHFFDGFRTSHELQKIELIPDKVLQELFTPENVKRFRSRAMTPDAPQLRGTSQNPDIHFQARETVNKYYNAAPAAIQKIMDRFAQLTGRGYKIVEYTGATDAEKVVVVMGSAVDTVRNTVNFLNQSTDAKYGVLAIRLYRPFDSALIADAIPDTVKSLIVLDRCKEPGSSGEPLYLDMVTALAEADRSNIKVLGGRYGISSKEFTPSMVKAVLENKSKNHFTIGINDDVTHTSLDWDPSFLLDSDFYQAMFYGLGSDGTVGANKNSIKIINDETDNYGQGFFVYDSKKAGAITTAHLRFGPTPIKAPYLIEEADFIACHQPQFINTIDLLVNIKKGGLFLVNTPIDKDELWDAFPKHYQEIIIERGVKVYTINAAKVAREAGMGTRINTVMQACFFGISGVLPKEEAIQKIIGAIKKTYGNKGEKVVQMNIDAVNAALDNMYSVAIPEAVTNSNIIGKKLPENAPDFVKYQIETMIERKGDSLPVSAIPFDGTFPTDTARWEKRDLTDFVPIWEDDSCIQCGKCAFVCPHAAIRAKAYYPADIESAPEGFQSAGAKDRDWKADLLYTIQVSPLDCTGCELCVNACPVTDKEDPTRHAINMTPSLDVKEKEQDKFNFFDSIPELDRSRIDASKIKQQQVQEPLFEFSGACAGCGETPYLKIISQLYGDRMVVGNATGCSSIYGGNMPNTPWAKNADGRGPAWINSLFEDNAEFALGMRLAVDQRAKMAMTLLKKLESHLDTELVTQLIENEQEDEQAIFKQRELVDLLKAQLVKINNEESSRLQDICDNLVKKSVWAIGGDGWAYDIGYGGLDHVMGSGENLNILIMDTEVYSNTGGQASKSTPKGAVAKFAMGGKRVGKKDFGMIAMSYGNIYVTQIAWGAKDS
ncbi:MAG: pyruvate:ferredoxin (flavodoxin) oxidoreductase, partial [Fibrobacterales bacterium]